MLSNSTTAAASIFAIGLALAACGDDAQPNDAGVDARVADLGYVAPLDRPALEAANALAADDPLYDGQIRFLWDTFDTETLADWPPTEFFLALQRDEPVVFGDQFAAFGFLPDPNDDLPVGFKRGTNDPSRVRETCALCHVGALPDGRVYIGAPNTELEFGRFTVEVNRRWVAAGNAPFLETLSEAKAQAWGPGRIGAESGAYPYVVPADFPPYFALGERARLNYLGTGRDARSEIYLSIFSAGAGQPEPDGTVPVGFPAPGRVDPFVAFMSAIAPPLGPPQDATRVARGAAVFAEARCDTCHHPADASRDAVTPYDRSTDGRERVPGDDPAFPSGSIRTSYPHRTLVDGDPDAGVAADDGRADLIAFIIRRRLSVGSSDGYRVAFLRGIWASPPYLHNGSVPTLEDLLSPAADRPATFIRSGFTVDTTTQGNSNQGHEFGTMLSADDKTALVAYLRSL